MKYDFLGPVTFTVGSTSGGKVHTSVQIPDIEELKDRIFSLEAQVAYLQESLELLLEQKEK